MTLDDTLRELMAERSDGRTVRPGHLDRVHHRLRRRRARRVSAAAAMTVVALAAVTGTAIAWPRETRAPEPPTVGEPAVPSATTPTTPTLTLPDRSRGQTLVEQKVEPLSPGHGEFTLVFTPRQWNFSISMDCVTTAVPVDYQIEVLINGGQLPHMVDTCGRTPGQPPLPEQPPTDDEQRSWWPNVHNMVDADTPIRLNEPMSITVRVGTPEGRYNSRAGTEIIRSGPFTAASGQAVVGVYQPG